MYYNFHYTFIAIHSFVMFPGICEDFLWDANAKPVQLPDIASKLTFAICEGYSETSKMKAS